MKIHKDIRAYGAERTTKKGKKLKQVHFSLKNQYIVCVILLNTFWKYRKNIVNSKYTQNTKYILGETENNPILLTNLTSYSCKSVTLKNKGCIQAQNSAPRGSQQLDYFLLFIQMLSSALWPIEVSFYSNSLIFEVDSNPILSSPMHIVSCSSFKLSLLFNWLAA